MKSRLHEDHLGKERNTLDCEQNPYSAIETPPKEIFKNSQRAWGCFTPLSTSEDDGEIL